MHQDLAELAITAVDNLFGQLTARIYACVAYTGRRSLLEIKRETKLNNRQIGSTLVVLVQHHLVYHGPGEAGRIFYYANWETAYNLAFRFGKLAEAANERLGSAAAQLLQIIATLGHANPEDLEIAFGLKKQSETDAPQKVLKPNLKGIKNVASAEDAVLDSPKKTSRSNLIKTVPELHATLDELLKHGFVRMTTEHHYMPETIYHTEAEAETVRQFYPEGAKTGKEKLDFEIRVREQKRKWRDVADSRAVEDPPAKKHKGVNGKTNGHTNGATNGHTGYGSDEEAAPVSLLPSSLVVQLNFDKAAVLIRNEQLIKLVERYIGDTTAKVYEALLRALEPKTKRTYDPLNTRELLWSDEEDFLFGRDRGFPGTEKILEVLDPSVDLSRGLENPYRINGVNGRSKVKSEAPRERDHAADTVNVQEHLRLLETNTRCFAIPVDRGWRVPYKKLSRFLIQYHINATVEARYGIYAARVLRVLHHEYSLDEKSLGQSTVLRPKDVRTATNILLAAGLIETQEIPRDTNRTTNRLLWLYAYNPFAARKRILVESYRAMTRLVRRADVERTNAAPVIEKSERSDVVGNEDKFLTAADKEALDQWKKKEAMLWGAVLRLDALVAVIRDSGPLDDPWIGNRKRPDGMELDEDD